MCCYRSLVPRVSEESHRLLERNHLMGSMVAFVWGTTILNVTRVKGRFRILVKKNRQTDFQGNDRGETLCTRR